MIDFIEDFVGKVPGSFVAAASSASPAHPRTRTPAQPCIDGGFIMGPGLDDVQRVIGAVDTVAHCPMPIASPLPDHRAYDAAVKAEAQKQEAAQAVANLLQARKLIIEAWGKLSDRTCAAMSQISFEAVAVYEKHTMLQFTTGDGVSIRIEWNRGLFN